MSSFISLLILVVSFLSFSQERATFERLKRDKEICKTFAEKSIAEINGGVLLVRLNFQNKKIDFLRRKGDSLALKYTENEVLSLNKKIAKSFSENFDFCDVYFFKMSDSRHVRSQDFDSLTFFNLELNEVNTVPVQSENYLIGEFSHIKQDTSHYYKGDRLDLAKENPKTRVYDGGSKNGREAFIIMDRKFQQIQKPFPYFAPLQILAPETTRYKKAIIKINQELHTYAGLIIKE